MKRSCRRTDEENRVHDQAVKIRKMTDEQLIRYIREREQKAAEAAKPAPAPEKESNVKGFLDFILKQKIQGIGIVTINKLVKVAKENEFI